MFPDSLRKGTEKLVNTAGKAIVGKKLVHLTMNNWIIQNHFSETYLFACTSTWYISTTAALLLMPVLFETERIQMEEAQKNHSKQVII